MTLALSLVAGVTFVGCATNPDPSADAAWKEAPGATTTTDADATTELAQLPAGAMQGAKLWADNCIRCHNIRPPRAQSDKQWEIIMMHMRVRASLTGVEQRQILKFLKAAN